MAQNSYQLINLTNDLVLTWPSSFSGGAVVLDINDVNPNQDNWTVALPNASLVQPGQNFLFNNISGFTFDIIANDLITTLVTVDPGQVVSFYLTDVSTTNGTWRIIPYGGGTNAITQVQAISSDSSITISNGVVTPPSGTINFQLPTSIYNLNKLSSTDLLVVTDTNPLTFRTVEIIGGENIVVSAGDGISNNPIIDLNSVVTSLNSLTVGNMTFSGDIITNNVINGNIQLNTNGTGKIQLNGIDIDVNGNISGITNLVAPKAYCYFTDTIVGVSNTIVIGDSVNISTVTGDAGTYRIEFTTPMASLEYGVFLTLGSTGGSLPFISNAYCIVKELTSVTIIVTDASGELVLSVPNGISVMVMAS